MRRFILTVSLSALGLFGQVASAPATGLKEYQSLALQHLWSKPGTRTFDVKSLPMEKVLSTAAIAERGCVTPLLEGKVNQKVDPKIRKTTPPANDRMMALRLLPVCASH